MSSRVVVVAKRSSYSRYVEDEEDPRVRQLLRQGDPVVARWQSTHDEHQRALERTLKVLDELGAKVAKVRRAHAAFDPMDAALVVVVGGDGTLLASSHSVVGTPILGVNSAPKSSVGFFCAARRTTVGRLLPAALEGQLRGVRLQRMAVAINGRVRARRVLNEALCCAASPAETSRYILSRRGSEEEQRSSGFWIGPAAGSTAAQLSAGGKVLPLTSGKLQLVVREPWAPLGRRIRFRRLELSPGEELEVRSKMHDARLFLDGPHRELSVRLGDIVTFRVSEEPLVVLGLNGRRERVKLR